MAFQADYIMKNAVILTMDGKQPRASAMAVWKDRILAVGDAGDMEPLAGPGTRVYDLGGKCVMPGFNDNHTHLMFYADSLSKVDCSGCRSINEMFRLLGQSAAETPKGQWLEGFGYDEVLFDEKREPTLAELDEAFPEHPIYIARGCFHVGLANSLALQAAGYTEETPDPPGGEIVRDRSGRLTGRLCENAASDVRNLIPVKTPEDMCKYIGKMSGIYNAYGITSGTDMGLIGGQSEEIKIWGMAAHGGYLKVRTSVYSMDAPYEKLSRAQLQLPIGDDLLRFAGRKILMDGSGGGGTARMRQPNTHDGKYGILYHTQEELDELVWEAHSKGQQVCTHAIGDRTIEMVLDAYKKAQERMPRPEARHRIEHCSFCFPDLIERVVEEKVYPLFHPGFLWYFGEAHLRNYGPERLAGEFPFRSMLDRGVIVGNGTDCPVTDPDPRPVLYATVTRKSARGLCCGEKERISMEEALWTYTAAGAFLTYEEHIKGTLTAGKLADFIVTDRNPLEGEPERILDMKIEHTVLGGETVFGGW